FMHYPDNMQTDLFFRYETGRLDTGEFREEVRRFSGLDLSDGQIDRAWTAMLVGIPSSRTTLLKKLSERYGLYMLSNTCPMHAPVFEKMFLDASGISMRDLFKKIFYSFEIGYHKPDREAFEYVIRHAGIIPEETFFLDDNIHNIKTSQELGFRAIHIHERIGLLDLGFDM
ncbi:MAG TPA: HAD family phosphatase, partial [Bacteroides sp.]|nr:HAD family phosphatase [Bacteroides sp.]